MTNEIERKFLLLENGKNYTNSALETVSELKAEVIKQGVKIRQGYLILENGVQLANELEIDIDFIPNESRIRQYGEKYFFTLKGKGALSRREVEKEIEQCDFDYFWPETRGRRVEKIRAKAPYEGYTAEIDVYTDRDLMIMEVEVPSSEEAQKLHIIGKDVTENLAYKNVNLAK